MLVSILKKMNKVESSYPEILLFYYIFNQRCCNQLVKIKVKCTVKWGYFEQRGYFEHFYIFCFFLFYILDYILKLINISFNLLLYLFVNQKNCLSYPASAT